MKISHSQVRKINSTVFVGILGMRLLGALQWRTVWHHSAFCRWGKTSRFWELGGTGCGWQSETFRRGWMSWRPSREPCSTRWTRSFGEWRVRLNPASGGKPNLTSIPWEWENDDLIIKFWFCRVQFLWWDKAENSPNTKLKGCCRFKYHQLLQHLNKDLQLNLKVHSFWCNVTFPFS